MIDINRYNPANTGFSGKTRPQTNGGQKNRPSQSEEHKAALDENWLLKQVKLEEEFGDNPAAGASR
jgi:hypothetical protein